MSDASEADRLEQELVVDEADEATVVGRIAERDPEAPEADALEQALPAPVDEDDRR
jgi:hypothetical protein